MLNSLRTRVTPSLVISCLALLIALSSTGVAATGKKFVLGQKNSAKKTTALSAKSAGATLKLTNTGNGPATAFFSKAGKAPFAVNGTTKVNNLNADLLDGMNSTDFLSSAVPVGPGTVTSASVLDDTVLGGGLGVMDLAANSVSSSEIQTDAVGATELQNDSIDSGEIVDFGLSNQDIGVLFAQVNADGTLANSSGGVASLKIGAGTYEVDFGRNISSCAYAMTQGEAGVGGAGGAITGITDRTGNAEAVFATTRTDANVLADRAFNLIVVC